MIFMQKNRLLTGALILFLMIIVSSCGIEKISRKKIKDIDFTVVAEIEMPLEVKQIVEKRKEQPFKVTYSDNQYTYIIIGLGNYGGGLAEELMAIGHEVIGVDQNEGRVDNLKDKITTAFVLDATDELALETLPLREIDVVIVAIGENFGASVRVVALLKQKKVKHIFARAIDSVHKAILEAFAIDKVLTPEKDAAREFVQFLALGIHAESFRVDEDYYVIKFKVPRKCAGYPLSGMNLEEDFHLKLIALKQAAEVKNILGMKKLTKEVMTVIPDNYLLKEEDELVCYGLYKDFQALWKAF